MLAPELEQILQQLYREARKAHYEFISLEHLLLVLIEEDASVPNVLKLCGADLKVVSEQLAASVAENTPPDSRTPFRHGRNPAHARLPTRDATGDGAYPVCRKSRSRTVGRFGRADERNRQPHRLFPQAAIGYAF